MAGPVSQKHNHVGRYVATVLLALGIIFSFLTFIRHNGQRIANQNEEYLVELTTQRAFSIDSLFAANRGIIQTTAHRYGMGLTPGTTDEILLSEFENTSAFEGLYFIDANGDAHTSHGVQANVADRAYCQDGLAGNSGVAYMVTSRVTGSRQIGFYAPVRHEDEVVGVMLGVFGEEYIKDILSYELFGRVGQGWLLADDGEVIGTTNEDEPDNFLDYLAQQVDGAADVDEVAHALREGEEESFSYLGGDGTVLVHAMPLEQSGWTLVRTFPPTANAQIVDNANHAGMVLLAELIGLFVAYVLFLGVDILVEQRRMREANRIANDISNGVSTLFDTFVTLDLDNYRYEYIGGTPNYQGLEKTGSYDEIARVVASLVPEEDLRAQTVEAFKASTMREALRDTDRISMRVHAPSGLGDWHTFNFVVIERAEDGTPRRLLVTTQDVTELHEREVVEQERLQQALDEAERASRAKTEFLFNMSHDLRTPMNAIIGYTELAQRDGVSIDEMRTFVSKIDASSTHLLSLINDILEMSRIESGKMTLEPEKCDPASVVDEARNLFSTQMREKGIHFMVDSCSSVRDRWVVCDHARLNRILLNLISNAFKFTPEGGSVIVTLVETDTHDGYGDYVLHVRDTGIGMSPDFVERLFTPFERERTSTVSRTQGTGLGLSITKKIVDLMGGTIEVDTAEGKGTEFVVRLTFPLAEAPREKRRRQDVSQADFTGTRVLLVEDQAVNREIATLILSGYGFVIDTAENGLEAVEKVVASEPGDYDLVLMDVQMPVMDGYEATRVIRALDDMRLARIPIIAMTANAFREDVEAARRAGMDGHIAKPIDVNKMVVTLSEVLGRGDG